MSGPGLKIDGPGPEHPNALGLGHWYQNAPGKPKESPKVYSKYPKVTRMSEREIEINHRHSKYM